jgi:hypothetical protein
MIYTELSQLNRECNTWRNELRNHRDTLNDYQQQLRNVCQPGITSDILVEVGHFENQFHIQLINIHDLRQSIKRHDRKIADERNASGGLMSDDTLNEHEQLFDDYQRLENTLHEIKQQFNLFVRQAK